MRKIALLLALGLTATSCRGGSDANGLELWTMQLKPTFTTYMETVLTEYRKQHPDLPVTWVDVPAAGLENKLLTAIAGGHPPDLVNLNPAFAAKLSEQNVLTPLDDKVKAIHGLYFPKVWEGCQLDGKTFAIPWYLSTAVTMANRDILAAAGLPPVPPATYDDVARMGAAVKASTGKALFMPNFGDSGTFMETLVKMGVPLLVNGAPAFASAAGETALQFWVDLYKAGIIPKESLTEKHREAIDRFQAGQIAMLSSGPQFLTLIKENAPQLFGKIVVGPQLSSPNGPIGVSLMNLVVPKASKHQDAAIALGAFLTNGENQLALAKLAPVLPSVTKAAADPFFTAGGSDVVGEARRISAGQLPRATVLVKPMTHQPELAKALDTALQQACLGERTARAALEEAATVWRNRLSH
ncbi:MAG: sugar ABC transporter substrate-binding protein [Candidatus Sericytochromatia bacterium]|nr:sugar ABC transporter substrate-binding protein [Candidatus Sericytochromatia bacterium]